MIRLSLPIALLAYLLNANAWAIDDGTAEDSTPDDTRYRIELLVFANSNPADEAAELWFPPRALPVPENLQVLMPALEAPITEDGDTPTGMTATGDDTDTAPVAVSDIPTQVEPFTELADISPEFAQAADRMRRSRHYRVLELTSWEQALPQGAAPVAVVIRGGEAFGQHHELEGTLSLRRERYLHAHARLWLSRFTEYTGETSEEDWPALPLLPTPPEHPVADNTAIEEIADARLEASPSGTSRETSSQEENAGLDHGTTDNEDAMDDVMPYDGWTEYDWFSPARPDRVVLMDQKRRLRSNELHYIDHPLFGVILRIVPIRQ